MYKIHVLFYFMSLLVYTEQLTKDATNYGPYTLDIVNISDCKGPKAKNMTVASCTRGQNNIYIYNMTFFADTKLDEIKVRVHNVKDNKKNFLWRYNLKDPCKHFSVALMIQQGLNADNNCVIKKGAYSIQYNVRDTMISFLGPSFFYGSYNFKSDILAKKGNILSITCSLVFNKAT